MRKLERLLIIAFLLVMVAGCITMQLSERKPDARKYPWLP